MTTTQDRPARPSPVRERLIQTASDLFYGAGIHATSADRVIAAVGTTKATFYRHFPTKDDLVLAYLEAVAEQERAEMQEAARPDDAQEALRGVVRVLGSAGCEAGFRGCPFINAAAEYPDAAHPVRILVAEHRRWWHSFFAELVQRVGVPAGEAADIVAGQFMLLRDGTLVTGYLDDPALVAARFLDAVTVIIRRAVEG